MISDGFCVLAFTHLQITPSGTAKMCCIAQDEISQDGQPLSVYRSNLETIWNSSYMREARSKMAKGERLSSCERCYRDERDQEGSYRTLMNAHWSEKQQAEMLDQASASDFLCAEPPSFYQLNMGNLCNLACRMCSGDFSTRILADPVLPFWNPARLHEFPKWKNGRLDLAPQEYAGVEASGFHPLEQDALRGPLRWSNGNGEISLPWPQSVQPGRLLLKLAAPPGQTLSARLLLNGNTIYIGELPPEGLTLDESVSDVAFGGKLRLRVLSSTVSLLGDARNFGAGLTEFAIIAKEGAKPPTFSLSRFSLPGGWWEQEEFLLNELLPRPEKLKRLMLQGGEPFLNKHLPALLDRLIESGASENLLLEFISNFTHLPETLLHRLARFKRVELLASIDGTGPLYEYIRYPAKWSDVLANLELIEKHPSVHLSFTITIQAYNLLRLADILDFCDKRNIDVLINFLVGPGFLSPLVLPLSARQAAAERLQAFCLRSRKASASGAAKAVIDYLHQKSAIQYCDMIESFMRFTNDLDASRDQSLSDQNLELIEAFEASGIAWSHARQYWKGPPPSLSADPSQDGQNG